MDNVDEWTQWSVAKDFSKRPTRQSNAAKALGPPPTPAIEGGFGTVVCEMSRVDTSLIVLILTDYLFPALFLCNKAFRPFVLGEFSGAQFYGWGLYASV